MYRVSLADTLIRYTAKKRQKKRTASYTARLNVSEISLREHTAGATTQSMANDPKCPLKPPPAPCAQGLVPSASYRMCIVIVCK